MLRVIAALTLALVAAPASPVAAAPRHKARAVCASYFDPGAGRVLICPPARRR